MLPEFDDCDARVLRVIAWEKSECDKRVAALTAKLAAAEKDAARYRWLRDNIMLGSGAGGWDRWSLHLPDPGHELETDKVFDAAIDAAIDACLSQRKGG